MRRLLAVVLLLAACTTPAPITDAAKTLASLHKVDDHPLFEMRYVGDYDEFAGLTTPTKTPFGCSLFNTKNTFGRNFDWDANPALVLHTDPPDGYASISLVDMSYLEGDPLKAPLLPFDGMNERGLVIGMAADTSGRLDADPGKQTVGSLRIIRLMLDHAATLEEALAIFGKYHLDFGGGPPLHYLIADATGASAVVEAVEGKLEILRGENVLTNFRLAGSDAATRQADARWATATAGLAQGKAPFDILKSVAQSHTRWSVVYSRDTGKVQIVTGKRWGKVHEFRI